MKCWFVSSASASATRIWPPGTEVSLNMDLIMNGRTVRGVIEGDAIPALFIPKLIELYSRRRFPFDQINQAVKDMEEGRVIKPVLRV